MKKRFIAVLLVSAMVLSLIHISFHRQFSGLSLFHRIPFVINNLRLPSVSGYTNSAYLMNVFNSKMYAPRSNRLTKAVIRVILMPREILFPVLNQAWRNRL